MTSHDDFRDDVEAYALGALDAEERVRFEAHLTACGACHEAVTSYGDVLESLRRVPVPLVPPAPKVGRKPLAVGRYAAIAAGLVGLTFGVSQVPKFVQYQRSEREYAAIAQMLATDPQEIALVGKSGASGRAIVGDRKRHTGFIASGLPAANGGMVYRVWVSGAHTRFSPGTLERTPEGLMVLVVDGDTLRGGQNVRITFERDGASTEGASAVLQGAV